MAHNSLLPPEMQAVYQQQFGGGGAAGPGGYVSQQSDPASASQMTYYHEGQLPGTNMYSQMDQTGQAYSSPNMYTNQSYYSSPAGASDAQPALAASAYPTPAASAYPTPLPNAQNFSSQPVMGHYNPQPFTAHAGQSMNAGIPPPFKPMPVLPPIQNFNQARGQPYRIESSPAVLQNTGSFGQYTLEGTLEYGTLMDDGDFSGSFELLPESLKQELQENYSMYPRTDVKIMVENGRYHLYASPVGTQPGQRLPPVIRPRFEHSPMSLHSVRRSVAGFPRPVFQRPITGVSEDYESVNLSRVSNYHNGFHTSPRRFGGGRMPVVFQESPYGDYDTDSVMMEGLDYPSPQPRVYADYLRSSRNPGGSRNRYASPTRYTARSQNRTYSDRGARNDSRLELAIRNVFRS